MCDACLRRWGSKEKQGKRWRGNCDHFSSKVHTYPRHISQDIRRLGLRGHDRHFIILAICQIREAAGGLPGWDTITNPCKRIDKDIVASNGRPAIVRRRVPIDIYGAIAWHSLHVPRRGRPNLRRFRGFDPAAFPVQVHRRYAKDVPLANRQRKDKTLQKDGGSSNLPSTKTL